MLLLSRRKEQKIRIGDEITITVIKIKPGVVSLGFDAPADVAIHRGEVYDEIKRGEYKTSATNHQVEE